MNYSDLTRLRISEYFSDTIHQLDLHFEEILSTYKPNKNLVEELKQLRGSYIDEIQNLKELNIDFYDKQQKFQREKRFDPNESIEKILQETCSHFCYFICKKSYFKLVPLYKFGILVVTDWFLSKHELDLIEDIFSNQNYVDYIGISSLPSNAFLWRVLEDTYSLSMETVNALNILKVSLKMDESKIIRISKDSKDPIEFKDYQISSFNESIFDKSPITRLQNIEVEDIVSLNSACLQDNCLLEELDIRYFDSLQVNQASLNQLNLNRYKGLKKLHLVNRYIKNTKKRGEYLKRDFFDCLLKLEDLKIDDPTILGFENNQFKVLECLKSLCINKVKLGSGKERLIVDTPSISLDIFKLIYSYLGFEQHKQDDSEMSNPIKNYHLIEIFNGLDNLEILNLSECYLCINDLYFLNKLANLTELNISCNSICLDGIDDSSKFRSLFNFEYLTKLNLSNNSIKTIEKEFFQGLTNLQDLDLSYNELEIISDFAFINLKKLNILNLDGNTNEFLRDHSLDGLISLEKLFIQPIYDHFSKIKSFRIFPTLKFLSIKANFHRPSMNKNNSLKNIKIDLVELFDGLDNLEGLIFSNQCFAVSYKPDFLQPIKKLKYLDLKLYLDSSDNEQTTEIFKGLDRIESLKLMIKPGIKVIRCTLFDGLHNLEKLDLSSNSISEIEDHAFDSLINLKELKLNNNKIKEINGRKIFSKLKKMQHLDLASNQIKQIQAGSFDNLTNLEYLYLQSNKLVRLDDSLLMSMFNLKMLVLSNQNISLRKENLENLYNLTHLKISKFETKINSDFFHSLCNLYLLVIQKCIVEEVTDEMFASTTNLKWLYLPSCRITRIHKNAFIGLTMLKGLCLAYNQLEDLRNVSFENLLNLEYIDARNDDLEYFDFSILDRLKKLKKINIYFNSHIAKNYMFVKKYQNKICLKKI